jgi:hypothetical protein
MRTFEYHIRVSDVIRTKLRERKLSKRLIDLAICNIENRGHDTDFCSVEPNTYLENIDCLITPNDDAPWQGLSFRSILYSGFKWGGTKEKHKFWEDVVDGIRTTTL